MSSPLSSARVRDLLRELRRLTAERSQAEAETAQTYASRTESARKNFAQIRAKLDAKHTADRAAADSEHDAARKRADVKAEEGLRAARGVHGNVREEALEKYQAAEEETIREYQEAKWTQDAMLEARNQKVLEHPRNSRSQIHVADSIRCRLAAGALDQLQRWKLVPPGAGAVESATPPADPLPVVEQRVNAAREQVGRLKGLIAPRLLVGDRLLWAGFVTWPFLAFGGYVWMSWWGVGVASAFTLLGGVGLWFFLRARSRSRAAAIGQPLFRDLAEAERWRGLARRPPRRVIAKTWMPPTRPARRKFAKRRNRTGSGSPKSSKPATTALGAADSQLAKLTADFTGARELEVTKVVSDYQAKVAAIEGSYQRDTADLTSKIDRDRAETVSWHTATFNRLATDWHDGTVKVRGDLDDAWAQDAHLFPDWSGPAWRGWSPPNSVPAGIRFGSLAVDVAALPGGQPADAKLPRFDPEQFTVPALLPFPHRCATLLHTAGEGKAAGVQALQAMMLRFLTGLPPGKVRFTIIDPVGLGENFAAFMHLADYDEQLVGARIWTETAQIEKRLADTTEHMENVIQKYLRNQYASIEEYNAQAGEVAEPYRVLVVANFPANFSLEAARRLASIAASGASCGVFTLVSVDPRQPAPQGFPLADLEQPSVNLRCAGQRMAHGLTRIKAARMNADRKIRFHPCPPIRVHPWANLRGRIPISGFTR